MAYINLWLETAGRPPVKVVVDSEISVDWLKTKLIAESGLPSFSPDAQLPSYRVVNLRTEKILTDENVSVSSLVREGDHLALRAFFASEKTDREPEPESISAPDAVVKRSPSLSAFSIAGITPESLDFGSEYSVLAINLRHKWVGAYSRNKKPPYHNTRPIYAKDTFFLVAGEEGRFQWKSPAECHLFLPEIVDFYPECSNRRVTRYTLNKDVGRYKNMIYPVRAFSITGINMDGFDPGKSYPVLAIDMDQYIKEEENPEEPESEAPLQTQSMAFFLVGDDNGEFAWIAEDECRLSPLSS